MGVLKKSQSDSSASIAMAYLSFAREMRFCDADTWGFPEINFLYDVVNIACKKNREYKKLIHEVIEILPNIKMDERKVGVNQSLTDFVRWFNEILRERDLGEEVDISRFTDMVKKIPF